MMRVGWCIRCHHTPAQVLLLVRIRSAHSYRGGVLVYFDQLRHPHRLGFESHSL